MSLPVGTIDPHYRKSLQAAVVITLPFVLFASFFVFGQSGFHYGKRTILSVGAVAFSSLILFLIFYTGRVHRYRRIFFTSYAVAFAISFVWTTAGDRGHMWLLDQEMLSSQAPMCHIVVPMLILPL